MFLASNRAIQAGSNLFAAARGRVQKGIQSTKTWLNKVDQIDPEEEEFFEHMRRMRTDKAYAKQVRQDFRDADLWD